MSRRRGEFEHRTSIFEGAFRAWSHLGGLDPVDLEEKPVSDLDPLTNPIENDHRLSGSKREAMNPDGSSRREYPYEPLPRSGLAHPYVQAILSPWLGPDADNEAINLGLTTLRTWWQHRRKGESGSAIAALGTEKMKGVVEGYTRHFFTLAHCLVVNDKEQPPRSLHSKMKELEKIRKKGGGKKRERDGAISTLTPMNMPSVDQNLAESLTADLTNSDLSPLERLHAAQRRQLAETGGLQQTQPVINIKGKCVPGKIDLPGVVDAVSRQAAQLTHRGNNAVPSSVPSSGGGGMVQPDLSTSAQYGDPNMTPVVFVSGSGDIMIAMTVDGITCAHCVKIVETVLRGCNGNKSPIEGLLDAAADRALCAVLIKIDRSVNAKRIAFEAARNLAMVGYTATAKEMSVSAGGQKPASLGSLANAFELVGSNEAMDIFDWTYPCQCPDNGVLRQDCSRHSQMGTQIFEVFDGRARQVTDYLASAAGNHLGVGNDGTIMPVPLDPFDDPLQVDQNMDFAFGMEPPKFPHAPSASMPSGPPAVVGGPSNPNDDVFNAPLPIEGGSSRAQRNPSVISYGNGLRNMSLTSDATFGRAMSGLSALSIDWENLEDFDLEVDHSAHINNGTMSPNKSNDPNGPRRSSIRRSFMSTSGDKDMHVSFKV